MKPVLIHTLTACQICATLTLALNSTAQQHPNNDSIAKTIEPGPQYKRSPFHNFLWGKHYRKEWSTPVTIQKFYLDTAAGGLTPYEAGGSRQTKSLKLHDRDDREYVLRSVDKTFGGALPENIRGTFIEKIADDQVSIAHPFSAVMVAPMAQAAGIYHTWPKNVYVPQQPALDTFNAKFGNTLYVFEQRPDENWETAANFGNSKKIISTDKLFEKLHEDNDKFVDQENFVRARLFDMLIGDWGRHEDQWRWASFKNDDGTLYKPIPRDRDQTFTVFDGVLLKLVKAVAGLSHQQSFGPVIKNIRTYNFAARNLDRFMTNRVPKQQWINTAKELQLQLTDDVIENAIHQMPPELFDISGERIIKYLKSRRENIVKYAEEYYEFLAKEVDVTGTDKAEYFDITSAGDDAIQLTIYDLDKEGRQKNIIYQRTFSEKETSELRIYGWNGNDIYNVDVPRHSNMTIRMIGGPSGDRYNISAKSNVHIYDGPEERKHITGDADLHLSADSSIHAYKYDAFKYNKAGIGPAIYYSKEQHIIYFGLAYNNTIYKWRREPFASTHQFYIHYSPTQNAIRTGYDGVVNQLLGKWNLITAANYDWVKVMNFYGVGNDTRKASGDPNFYRIRMENGFVSAGLSHGIGTQGSITFAPFFQTVKLLNDPDRYLIKDYLDGVTTDHFFDTKQYAGFAAYLKLQKLDDDIIPRKGVRLTGSSAFTKNIEGKKNVFTNIGDLYMYFPLSKHFVLAVKNGIANTSGDAEFYQLNSIGGRKLRGYRRERFLGPTAYYNNNELQYLFKVRSILFNGTAGFMAFADQGRVWLKGEHSDTWHYGYGGGVILSPFNRLYIAVMYGVSPENPAIIHLDLSRRLK